MNTNINQKIKLKFIVISFKVNEMTSNFGYETPPTSPLRINEDVLNAPRRVATSILENINPNTTRRRLFPADDLHTDISPISFVNQSGVYYQTPIKNKTTNNDMMLERTPSYKNSDTLSIEQIENLQQIVEYSNVVRNLNRYYDII